jgi:hypothetical protein
MGTRGATQALPVVPAPTFQRTASKKGIDNGARIVYVHCTPNADGSNPERGRRADADGFGRKSGLSAFCCARLSAIGRSWLTLRCDGRGMTVGGGRSTLRGSRGRKGVRPLSRAGSTISCSAPGQPLAVVISSPPWSPGSPPPHSGSPVPKRRSPGSAARAGSRAKASASPRNGAATTRPARPATAAAAAGVLGRTSAAPASSAMTSRIGIATRPYRRNASA